jgi:hypothetical protein
MKRGCLAILGVLLVCSSSFAAQKNPLVGISVLEGLLPEYSSL